jgi:scyllo-inositol 2-dehydrogenase (NADP+)
VEKIRVGLVGYGLAGSVFHAPLIGSVDALELVSVATSRAELVRRSLPDVLVLPHAEDLFSDPAVELIVIATPTATHFELARAALLAGKHVVVDKPFTLTSREADELIALAQRQGRMLSVFQNRRWDNDFLTVKRCLSQGRLGEVYYYEAHFDRFRPAIKEGWREVAAPGAGILYDLGAHLIDQALLLFGPPDSVTADVMAQRPAAKVPDYFHLILHYGRKRVVLHGATLVREPGPRFIVHGDGGSFLKYGIDPQEEALAAGRRPGGADWGREAPELFGTLTSADGSREKIETLPGAYQDYYKGIAACLRGGAAVPVDPADCRAGIGIIEAAERRAA